MTDDNKDNLEDSVILIGSILSDRTQRGMVEITLKGQMVQLPIGKAREVCGMLLAAIEAAVTDELIYAFLRKTVGASLPETYAILHQMRRMRHGTDDLETVYPLPMKAADGN